MPISTYTGSLNVLGAGGDLSRFSPRLSIRPEIEATGQWGVISTRRRPIPFDNATGDFQVTLYPSTELVGADGRAGVKYILDLALFDETFDGSRVLSRHDLWVFTAVDGGGPIHEMGDWPAVAFIAGPPWPSHPRPGTYFDTETGDLGYYGFGVN